MPIPEHQLGQNINDDNYQGCRIARHSDRIRACEQPRQENWSDFVQRKPRMMSNKGPEKQGNDDQVHVFCNCFLFPI